MDRIVAARNDPVEFCTYVGWDSRDGSKIKMRQIHEDFQILMDIHKCLILMAHPESGKTSGVAWRLLYELGKNPNLNIAIVSVTGSTSTKISRTMREAIEKSTELGEVFPALVRGDKWEEDFWSVQRSVFSNDPTVQAIGITGKIIGSRIDILVFDDILDDQNTATAAERAKTIRRIRRAFMDRMRADGRIWFLTNAWHPEDAAHVFEKEGTFHCAKFPVLDENGESSWPQEWSLERIEDERDRMGPLEFARAFLCKARDEGESPFDEDAWDDCVTAARSEKLELVRKIEAEIMAGNFGIFTGVDLAVTKKKTSHYTALVTCLVWYEDMSRQLLWAQRGRYSSREIRNQILLTDECYSPIFIVENNAAQRWIIDIIGNQLDLPEHERRMVSIIPFTTGRNKAHPQFGVEGLAVEMARPGTWLIPEGGPTREVREAVKQLRTEALYYVRGQHPGDLLMGLWFAREGCRRGARAGRKERDEDRPEKDDLLGGGGGVRIIGSDSRGIDPVESGIRVF